MIYSRPSESRPAWQEKEEGPLGALNAYSWAIGAPSSSYQGSRPILQGISKQAMGSLRQNTDEPPSTQAAATQDWGLSRVLSFQYKNFTHFNGHYNFKESNFHHCLSSASWFVERGSFCMNSTQKPAFPLEKELPLVFEPSKLQRQLLNYCSFQLNIFCQEARLNLINRIYTLRRLLKSKGKDEQKRTETQKCWVIISGCPIYLTLTIPACRREEENMFSSTRGGNDKPKWSGFLQAVSFYFQWIKFKRSVVQKFEVEKHPKCFGGTERNH